MNRNGPPYHGVFAFFKKSCLGVGSKWQIFKLLTNCCHFKCISTLVQSESMVSFIIGVGEGGEHNYKPSETERFRTARFIGARK